MPIVIKEIHVRTVVERKIITQTDISEEVIRKIESEVVDRLSEYKDGQSVRQFNMHKHNDR